MFILNYDSCVRYTTLLSLTNVEILTHNHQMSSSDHSDDENDIQILLEEAEARKRDVCNILMFFVL